MHDALTRVAHWVERDVELFGVVAPDETTFNYLRGREFAPSGAKFDEAIADWRTLRTDDGAVFDKEVSIDAS